jgi:hypothetical protein
MTTDPTFFYLPDRKALQDLDPLTIDPDREWWAFGTGVYIWILQTFLRLSAESESVQLINAPPVAGIVVVHADHTQQLLAAAPSPGRLIVVSVRADRRRQTLADLEIVQNASSAGPHQTFIPSWLQPGLVARDPTRGMRVERIAYMGNSGQLHDDLREASWQETLRRRGLTWDPRTTRFVENDHVHPGSRWNDYSIVDVIVALRPPAMWRSWSKPAAKLQNAWAAGVPAVLSPEVPYREFRRSALDYLEASSGSEALDAIERLRADRDLYAAMVENGLSRAREFQHERLLTRWRDVLWREAPARQRGYRHRLLAGRRRSRAVVRRLRATLSSALGTPASVPGQRQG